MIKRAKFEPQRMNSCLTTLEKMGFTATKVNDTTIIFYFKGEIVTLYPYTGWHTGKTIKDGRGFNNLLTQLKVVI
jgi:hypothetical protein